MKKLQPKGKLVRCCAYEPIGVSTEAEQPWSDTWVTITDKPGRRKYHYGPTIIGRYALQSDIDIQREMIAEGPHTGGIGEEPHRITWTITDEDIEKQRLHLAELEAIAARLDAGEPMVIDEGCGKGLPEIYCRERAITRAVAEQAVAVLMVHNGHNHGSYRFKWKRQGWFIVTPSCSLTDEDIRKREQEVTP